ncbi:MAG: MBL fold metallo-hydrolase [Longimicrobiales bacterium]|nr:MBL fold metallo-hydrolase [Longimicrobiales bacterium]
MLDRREFTRLLLTGAAGLALPHPLRAGRGQESFFTWHEIAPGIRAAIGGGGNVLLLSDGGEALISDAKNLGLGHTLRREAEAFGARVTRAVNTHHHGDHTGGNIAFARDLPLLANSKAAGRIRAQADALVASSGARIDRTIAQLREGGSAPAAVLADLEREREALAQASPDQIAPNETIENERELRVGRRVVHLRHVGHGHTDNDLFLHLPDANVIHTGDLLFVGRHGFMDQNGGVDSEGWQRSVRAMIELCDAETVVVSGHGAIVDREGLQRQYEYFGVLRDAVEAAVAEGRTKEEVQALRPDALAEVEGDPSRNLGVVYDEVTSG